MSQRVVDLRKRKPGVKGGTRRSPFSSSGRPPARGGRSSLRERRRKMRLLVAIATLIIAGGAVFGLRALLNLPRLSIESIQIVGAKEVTPETIRVYVDGQIHDGAWHFFSRENIFFYPKRELQKGIPAHFSRIRSADVARTGLFSRELAVKVRERVPLALWCRDGEECFVFDESGFIFAAGDAVAESELLVFRGGLNQQPNESPIRQVFLPDTLKRIVELTERLKEAGFPAAEVAIENDTDFSMWLMKGFSLRGVFSADPSALVRNLQLVLTSDALRAKADQLEYIDMRFGNRVYYKLKGEQPHAAN